jgi:CPA2 family monovalent cation:H+ antiporter-2
MAVYLPLVAVLIAGGGAAGMLVSIAIAAGTVMIVLFIAIRYGNSLSVFVAHQSDEIILLTTFGTVLLVAGLAQRLQISAAIGAFLVGIAVSGPIAEQSHRLLSPLRDLFAATFSSSLDLKSTRASCPLSCSWRLRSQSSPRSQRCLLATGPCAASALLAVCVCVVA